MPSQHPNLWTPAATRVPFQSAIAEMKCWLGPLLSIVCSVRSGSAGGSIGGAAVQSEPSADSHTAARPSAPPSASHLSPIHAAVSTWPAIGGRCVHSRVALPGVAAVASATDGPASEAGTSVGAGEATVSEAPADGASDGVDDAATADADGSAEGSAAAWSPRFAKNIAPTITTTAIDTMPTLSVSADPGDGAGRGSVTAANAGDRSDSSARMVRAPYAAPHPRDAQSSPNGLGRFRFSGIRKMSSSLGPFGRGSGHSSESSGSEARRRPDHASAPVSPVSSRR